MSEGFTVSARQTGRPAALTGDRERECYELLERLGIAYEWVEFSRQPETTAEAEEVDKALGVPGLKNLIFQNRNRSRTLFLLLPREKRLDAKALAKSRNITRLSMVNAAALEDLLHTHAGAVGAMELMYDMEGKLELFIDREVLDGPFVRFPPNADGRLVRIATSDFVDKLLPAIKHGYTVLEADDPAFTGAEILPEAPFAFRKMRDRFREVTADFDSRWNCQFICQARCHIRLMNNDRNFASLSSKNNWNRNKSAFRKNNIRL